MAIDNKSQQSKKSTGIMNIYIYIYVNINLSVCSYIHELIHLYACVYIWLVKGLQSDWCICVLANHYSSETDTPSTGRLKRSLAQKFKGDRLCSPL